MCIPFDVYPTPCVFHSTYISLCVCPTPVSQSVCVSLHMYSTPCISHSVCILLHVYPTPCVPLRMYSIPCVSHSVLPVCPTPCVSHYLCVPPRVYPTPCVSQSVRIHSMHIPLCVCPTACVPLRVCPTPCVFHSVCIPLGVYSTPSPQVIARTSARVVVPSDRPQAIESSASHEVIELRPGVSFLRESLLESSRHRIVRKPLNHRGLKSLRRPLVVGHRVVAPPDCRRVFVPPSSSSCYPNAVYPFSVNVHVHP